MCFEMMNSGLWEVRHTKTYWHLLRCLHKSMQYNARQCQPQEVVTCFKSVGTKMVCLVSSSCIGCAMEVLVKSRACGQSHVSLYSLWVVPWGAVWLLWDNLLITIQYGPLEREPWNFLFLPSVNVKESDHMSKSRHFLFPTLKWRRVPHFWSFLPKLHVTW